MKDKRQVENFIKNGAPSSLHSECQDELAHCSLQACVFPSWPHRKAAA